MMRACYVAGILSAVLGLAPISPLHAESEQEQIDDPAEPTNRAIFAANQYIDHHLLRPVAVAYHDDLPSWIQRPLHDFSRNLGEPLVLMNDLLQGNGRRAWVTTQRFVLDSTIGAGGLFDVAEDWNLPYHTADFGQTFGVWGVEPGPAVQLPLLGFSNVRDTVGKATGILVDPLGFIPGATITDLRVVGSGTGLVDYRAEIMPATNSLEETSLDYYAALRSVVVQNRATLVEQGRVGTAP